MVSEKSKKALAQLIRKRDSLREEVLGELSSNLSNGIIEILRNTDLADTDLTGKEAYAVGSTLTRFLTERVGERKVVASLLCQWEFLYPIEVEITINDLAAVEYIMSQMDQNLSE